MAFINIGKFQKQIIIESLEAEKTHTINAIKEIDNTIYYSVNVYFQIVWVLVSRVNLITNLINKLNE